MVNPVRHKGSQIFSYLADKFPDESFIAAGGWAIKKSGHNKKDDKWEYLSHTDDFSKFYKLLKLLVVPTQDSHCETFGRVVIEAMKYGVPVIASKKDGLIEASNGSILLIEDYNNPLVWEDMVRKMLDENTLMMWHELAKKRAIEYTIDLSINEWKEVFEFVSS
jgi:glycosyltransferase involved in cell wall biosynthesis